MLKITDTQTTGLQFTKEGDAYFKIGDTKYYLNEFVTSEGHIKDFDAITHITNVGGLGINIDEEYEEVEYSFFTI